MPSLGWVVQVKGKIYKVPLPLFFPSPDNVWKIEEIKREREKDQRTFDQREEARQWLAGRKAFVCNVPKDDLAREGSNTWEACEVSAPIRDVSNAVRTDGGVEEAFCIGLGDWGGDC